MATPRARTSKAAADTGDEPVSNENEDVKTAPPVPVSDGTEENWYDGFDEEEFPDIIVVGEGELLEFEVISSNIVPIENKRTGNLEDTEVCQVLVMSGTTATVKMLVGEGKNAEYVSTGEIEPTGEIRSLWINNTLLRKIWGEWEVQTGDVGVVKYVGHVESKRGNEYQKWFGKFRKDRPRRVLAR